MDKVVIVDGLRTPFCKMGTQLAGMSAQQMGAVVSRELLERLALDPHIIDEVIYGNVAQPPEAANIARVVALLAGIPYQTPAFTVNRNCASGIEAVVSAALRIREGEAQCILAGGTESMSNIPLFFSKKFQTALFVAGRAKTFNEKWRAWWHLRWCDLKPNIGLRCGLTDVVSGLNMGQTAEVLAKEFGITRQEQDAFALVSHKRATACRAELGEEIMTVIPPPAYESVVQQDNGPREQQTMTALEKLSPVFDRRAGTVTAGNASQITDGAVSLLLMSERRADELQLKPLGYLRAFATAGVEAQRMGIGPAHAIPQVLKKADLRLSDMDAIEINEAFAVQVLACLRLLADEPFATRFGYDGYTGEIPSERVNVYGGAIALGHPVGATGARLVLTMLKHLKRNNLKYGCASLCVGGGQGAAVILERL